MKNRISDKITTHPALAAVLIAAFAMFTVNVFAVDCEDDQNPPKGQKCTAKGTEKGGGCSGACVSGTCSGSKTETMYNGCNSCTSGTSDQTCKTFTGTPTGCESGKCEYKTRTADCSCIALACDVPQSVWPPYPTVWTTSNNGNSCKP